MLGLVSWLVTRDEDEVAAGGETAERIVSEAQLVESARSFEQAVYWAGPVQGTRLQLIESPDGVKVRYLKAGIPAAESLAVATYPTEAPEAELRAYAERAGSFTREGVAGRVLVSSEEQPTSVYFASADGSVQVEVYAPSPERAMALARSVRVRPVR